MPINLAHIATMAFNRPVLLEPGYARLFYATLAGRMGVDAIINVQGEKEAVATLKQEGSSFRRGGERSRSYQLIDGVAVLPVSGTLTHKYGYVNPSSGMTGYDGIQYRLGEAMADPDVRGIMLDFDTPGGTVAGAFDTADLIRRYGQLKPIWSLGYDLHASAGQLLSAAAGRRLITQTGVAGSIGVLVAHTNMQALMEEKGVEITLIHSGAHKVDGNPYQALPDDVRARIQAEVDDTRQRFAAKVAEFTGLSLDAVMATEAQTYEGQAAVDVGLADEVVNGADAVAMMIEHLNRNTTHKPRGANMDISENQPAAQGGNNGQQAAAPAATEQQLAEAGKTAATAERERVMGILNCDEAKGREQLAGVLVTQGMSLEAAKAVLAAAPLAAVDRQANTELDRIAAAGHGQAVDTQGDDGVSDKTAGLKSALGTLGNRGFY
jgi:capsid assembly protease